MTTPIHENQDVATAGRDLRQATAAMIMIHGRGATAESILTLSSEFDAPGRPRSRVACYRCGEGINDSREVQSTEGENVLCRPCAEGGYYRKKLTNSVGN